MLVKLVTSGILGPNDDTPRKLEALDPKLLRHSWVSGCFFPPSPFELKRRARERIICPNLSFERSAPRAGIELSPAVADLAVVVGAPGQHRARFGDGQVVGRACTDHALVDCETGGGALGYFGVIRGRG